MSDTDRPAPRRPAPPGPPIDAASFERLRRVAPGLLAARRDAPDDWRARSLPEEVSFKLTNRCDLRCTHCYQWGPAGYHRLLPAGIAGGDLDLAIVAKVLEATRAVRSIVYLWGGEPLLYRDWDGLVGLLVDDPRWTSICTNGTLVPRRLPSLVALGERVEMSLSIDGFEAEHDAVRGTGAFARAWGALQTLLESRRDGGYRGQVTVNFVVTDPMVERAHAFVEALDAAGVDTIYVSLPWYLAPEGAARMDDYVARHFAPPIGPGAPSWHAYTHRIDPSRVDALAAQLARIDATAWRAGVRHNPRLEAGELRDFLLGSDRPARGRTRCTSTRARLDVFPDGGVVSCKFFPEFHVGDLHGSSLEDVWHGARFDRVRETVSRCGLMPACAKCNLLYTRGM